MTAGIRECPRVAYRMECPECGYPYSEAAVPLDPRMPHFLTECEDLIEETIFEYEEAKRHDHP